MSTSHRLRADRTLRGAKDCTVQRRRLVSRNRPELPAPLTGNEQQTQQAALIGKVAEGGSIHGANKFVTTLLNELLGDQPVVGLRRLTPTYEPK